MVTYATLGLRGKEMIFILSITWAPGGGPTTPKPLSRVIIRPHIFDYFLCFTKKIIIIVYLSCKQCCFAVTTYLRKYKQNLISI